MNDSPEMVRTLLDLGADAQAKDGEGKTALDRAVEFNCNRVQPILREAMGLPPRNQARRRPNSRWPTVRQPAGLILWV